MNNEFKGYVPKTVGELLDQLGSMMLRAPTFMDQTGYFPEMSLDTEFHVLNEGLEAIRRRAGEERYQTLVSLAAQMRALFEADQEDLTGEAKRGRELILEMEDVLKAAVRPQASHSPD